MTDRPKLRRPSYWVWTTPEGIAPDAPDDQLDATLVVITAGDQLRAELEGRRHQLDAQTHPMHLSLLWIWAAMVRTGETTDKWLAFRDVVVSYQPVDDEEPDGELVRPTEASSS